MTKKAYFEQISRRGFVNSKSFWNTVKPSKNITIENKDQLVGNKLKFTEVFNTHYINIVDNSSVFLPVLKGNPNNPSEHSNTVKNIIEVYKNHPRIIKIRN